MRSCAAQAAWLGLGAGSRVLQLASPSFDASVWELCAALLSGAALVLAPLRWQAPHHIVATTMPTPAAMSPVNGIAAVPSARRASLDWSTTVLAIWITGTVILLLLVCHHLTPGLDIVRAFGDALPLRTHRLPRPQLTTCVTLALILSSAAFLVVRTREY